MFFVSLFGRLLATRVLTYSDRDEAGLPPSVGHVPGTEVAHELGTILLAEGDEIVRKALRRTLANHGYDVLEARSGEEAVDLCAHHEGPINLLLSDISLDGLHGPELARAFTRIRPFTRVLFLTAGPEEINMDAGICPGCWLLVRKPFRPQELVQALAEFLRQQVLRACTTDSLLKSGLVDEPLTFLKPAAS